MSKKKDHHHDVEDPHADYTAVPTPMMMKPATTTATHGQYGRTVLQSQYLHMPEAQELFWNDDFFDEDENVIAVFDFDYEKMYRFKYQVAMLGQSLLPFEFMFWWAIVTGIIQEYIPLMYLLCIHCNS